MGPSPEERIEVASLHRYYIWQNQVRVHFHDELREARERGEGLTHSSEAGITVFLYMSYWYAGLYVVIEGWRELGLQDDEIGQLLDSPNVDLLRRYRNGVFHFQRTYYDERFIDLLRGADVVDWTRALNSAFGRALLERMEA